MDRWVNGWVDGWMDGFFPGVCIVCRGRWWGSAVHKIVCIQFQGVPLMPALSSHYNEWGSKALDAQVAGSGVQEGLITEEGESQDLIKSISSIHQTTPVAGSTMQLLAMYIGLSVLILDQLHTAANKMKWPLVWQLLRGGELECDEQSVKYIDSQRGC